MTKDQAGAAMYTFLRAIMSEVGIEGDTLLSVKMDGNTVKSVRLDEALAAWELLSKDSSESAS